MLNQTGSNPDEILFLEKIGTKKLDLETLRVVGPYVGGACAVFCVLLNFALGRWAAADATGREKWQGGFVFVIDIALSLFACSAVFLQFWWLCWILFTIQLGLQVVRFVIRTGLPTRTQIVAIVLQCSLYCCIVLLLTLRFAVSNFNSEIKILVDFDRSVASALVGSKK